MKDAVHTAREWLKVHGSVLLEDLRFDGVLYVRALLDECAALRETVDQHADRLEVERCEHDEMRGYRQKAEQERDALLGGDPVLASLFRAPIDDEPDGSASDRCDVPGCRERWTVARCDEHAVVKRCLPDDETGPEPL